VAPDLAPASAITARCFDGRSKAGVLISVADFPKFRLPEFGDLRETDYILALGIEFKGASSVESLKTPCRRQL